ncbi:hypothetical protein [Dialister sp.]|uniref:hypothetical protein n=1 Tax=Dialister sp. TaxID=1955814 RepID=UPI003F0B8E65
MPFLFFWCLFLCAINAYLVFAYKTELSETFEQKMTYFLGGHIAFVYNLCFPWMAWFMTENLRPALICLYLLLNYCTLARMMHVDYHGLINVVWGDASHHHSFALRLKLEKLSAALFLGISTWLFGILGFLVKL